MGTSLKPDTGAIGPQFYGPQPGHRCTGTEPGAPADPKPSACDDGPFGKGTGGELTYTLSLPANGSKTVWLGVAGSDQGGANKDLGPAQQELTKLLQNPSAALAAKMASREQLAQKTQLSLPGDPLVQNAVDWGKQNIADLTLSAQNLQIRWTNQGKQFPAPLGTVPEATWIGAGYPDYPWIFGTDGEYTAFASVAVGQFAAIEDHLRTLRDISDILNNRSGVVVHESVSDGSIWFGHDSRQTTNGTTTYDFNTDETVKFPSAVALVWRWTGDNAFRDEMYDFTVRNLHYVVNTAGCRPRRLAGGLGQRRAHRAWARRSWTTRSICIRGLYDLSDMARSKHDGATFAWAKNLASKLQDKFDSTWWYPGRDRSTPTPCSRPRQPAVVPAVLDRPDAHGGWSCTSSGQTVPGLAPFDHGNAALAGRENDCFSGTPPFNPGLFHTGCTGPPNGAGEKVIYGLTTSIQSVGEGNYGRLGPGRAAALHPRAG